MDTIDTGPTESRDLINFRIRRQARSRLDELAHKHSLPGLTVNRSDVIRASLAVAANHAAELDKTIISIRGEA